MQAHDNATVTPLSAAHQAPTKQRKRLFTIFIAVAAVLALAAYGYYVLFLSTHITTNNAYTAADIPQITSQTSGTVKTILVIDTQPVKAGDILVTLDTTDATLNLTQAEASVARYESDLTRTESNYNRRKKLASSGYLSTEELNNADSALKIAKANLDAARASLAQARIDLERLTLRAPVNGIVAKRAVQLGQRITTGEYLLSIIPTSQIYVNANFKEIQLKTVSVGQPVVLHADIYGSSVTYHGRVAGIAGGTGSSFAVIPAQNATGNWIKVVQRIPVRIELDPESLAQHPLQVGLSMSVDIDTGKQHV